MTFGLIHRTIVGAFPLGSWKIRFSLYPGQIIIMQKLCDDLNKVLPRITGHLLGLQLTVC